MKTFSLIINSPLIANDSWVLCGNFKNGIKSETGKAATADEIAAVSLSPDILTRRIAEPWQREILGVVKDPTYTFHATTRIKVWTLVWVIICEEQQAWHAHDVPV